MEGAGAVTSVIIRTPDHRVKDLEVECQPKWTVANLKQYLSTCYPGNPSEDKQRLILAGKLLQDKTHLDELFKTYEYRPIIHFVCTQTMPEPASDSESTVNSPRSSVSTPTTPVVEANAERPAIHMTGNPRWSAHMTQLQMWHQQLQDNQAAAAFYNHGPPHHLTQAVLRRAAEQAQDAPQPAAVPAPQQPAAPPQPAEPAEQHDLLDVFYLMIRAMFLLALAWNYASPAKFCFMGVLLFYLYLYQGGYISLPALFASDHAEAVEEGEEQRQPSAFLFIKNALLSFFTSLLPSNENNVN